MRKSLVKLCEQCCVAVVSTEESPTIGERQMDHIPIIPRHDLVSRDNSIGSLSCRLYTLFLRNAGYVPKPFPVQQLEDPVSCVSSIDETPVISAQNGDL